MLTRSRCHRCTLPRAAWARCMRCAMPCCTESPTWPRATEPPDLVVRRPSAGQPHGRAGLVRIPAPLRGQGHRHAVPARLAGHARRWVRRFPPEAALDSWPPRSPGNWTTSTKVRSIGRIWPAWPGRKSRCGCGASCCHRPEFMRYRYRVNGRRALMVAYARRLWLGVRRALGVHVS